jgi:hypothetical protein
MNERDASKPEGDLSPDDVTSTDDPTLSEYDKEMADSFPASDPPAQP